MRNMNFKFDHIFLYILIYFELTQGVQFPGNKFATTQLRKNLNVFSANYEPFTYQNDKGVLVHGIEYFLVQTIAKKMNRNISFKKTSRRHLLERWKPMTK